MRIISRTLLATALSFTAYAHAEIYIGVGGGLANGDGWSDGTPEVVLGSTTGAGFGWQAAAYELGSRNEVGEEKAAGVSLEGRFVHTVNRFELSFGGGLYLYGSDREVGDSASSDIQLAPLISASGGCRISDRFSLAATFRQYFLADSFGSPNRVSLTLNFQP